MRSRPEHYREGIQFPLVSDTLGDQISTLPFILQELVAAALNDSLKVARHKEGESVWVSGIFVVCRGDNSATANTFSSMHLTSRGIQTNVVIPQLFMTTKTSSAPISHHEMRIIVCLEGSYYTIFHKTIDVTPEILAAMEEVNILQNQLAVSFRAEPGTTRHRLITLLRKIDPRNWIDTSKKTK